MSWQDCEQPEDAPGTCPAIEMRIAPRARDIGGFEVRRALPTARRMMVGPFIFWDQMGLARFARLFKVLSKATHPGRHPALLSLRLCVRSSSSLRLCGSACQISDGPNAEKPPLFSDGYRPGAIRELEVLYAPTVTVSRKFLKWTHYRII